jgi:Cu/Ag efflux protein CusF
MVARVWLISGILLVVLAWILMVPLSPPTVQQTPMSMIEGYRADGLMPALGAFEMSDEIGHDVFEVPATDAAHLKEALAAGAMEDMAHGEGTMEGMPEQDTHMAAPMDKNAAQTPDTPGMQKQAMETMPQEDSEGMPDGAHQEPAMEHQSGETMEAMDKHRDEELHAASGHGRGGEAAGISILAQGSADTIASAVSGLTISKTVELTMDEWGYRPNHVMVAPGDLVRLIVRHAGNTPHEFMLMTAPAMGAVNYRLTRADWNLLEHEALFEKPVVLPGDSFQMVLRIHKPGMCKGVVIAIVAAKRQVVLDHEEIEGFMDAMTMGYPVASEELLQGLNAGDTVKFQIDATSNEIIAFERSK